MRRTKDERVGEKRADERELWCEFGQNANAAAGSPTTSRSLHRTRPSRVTAPRVYTLLRARRRLGLCRAVRVGLLLLAASKSLLRRGFRLLLGGDGGHRLLVVEREERWRVR